MQLVRRLLGADRGLLPQDHISGVQPLAHIHAGHAGDLLAPDYAPLDRPGAPVLGQQRGVQVDAAILWNVKYPLGQYLAVGNHHHRVGDEGRDLFGRLPVAQGFGLINRDIVRLGQDLDRRLTQLVAPSHRLVRLGVDGQHLVVVVQQPL